MHPDDASSLPFGWRLFTIWTKRPSAFFAHASSFFCVGLLLLYVTEAVTIALLYELLMDEEEPEDYLKFIGRETGAAIFGDIPFVRDAASAFSGYGGGGFNGSVLEIPSRLCTQAVQDENDRALRRALGDFGGVVTGLPTTSSLRMIR